MRIDDNGMANVNASQLNRAQAPDSVEQQNGRQPTGQSGSQIQDKVNLSSLALSVQSLQQDSPTREAHLAKLAADFQAGRLQPDAERIAGALIDSSLGESSFDS